MGKPMSSIVPVHDEAKILSGFRSRICTGDFTPMAVGGLDYFYCISIELDSLPFRHNIMIKQRFF